MTDQPTLREKIAQSLRDFIQPEGFYPYESDYIFADRILPLIAETVAAEVENAAGELGVHVGDEDDDWWSGYRHGQRQQIRVLTEYARILARNVQRPALNPHRKDGLQ